MPHIRIIHDQGTWEKLIYLEPTDESKIRNTKVKYNTSFYIKSVDEFIQLFTNSTFGQHTNLKNNRTCQKGGELYRDKLKQPCLDAIDKYRPDGYYLRFVGFFIDNNLKQGHSCEIIYSRNKKPQQGQYVKDELVINLHLKFHDNKSPLNMGLSLLDKMKTFRGASSYIDTIKQMKADSHYPQGFAISNHPKSTEALRKYQCALAAKQVEKETLDEFGRIPSDLFTCTSFK